MQNHTSEPEAPLAGSPTPKEPKGKRLSRKAIEERLRFEAMLSRITAKFIGLPPQEVDENINAMLGEVGEYFQVDRVVLVRFSQKGDLLGVTHAWTSPQFNKEKHISYALKLTYPNTTAHLMKVGELVFGKLEDFPNWPPELEMMKELGINAAACVKIGMDGPVLEAFVLDSLRSNRVWPEDIVDRLKFLGSVVANAVYRKTLEIERDQALTRIKELKDRLERENVYLREEVRIQWTHEELVGNSEALKRVVGQAEQVAPSGATALITGETGTGKERIARLIHKLSPRKDRQMIKVNCATLPGGLVESELFGRERGAYTGALTKQIGRFELANGSSIFLDEVGELPPDLQVKLLRVLEEGKLELLGSPRVIKVDVRIIAATNRDLKALVEEGKFRKDLFYRLNVFPIHCPTLRERREDIPQITWHFVNQFNEKRLKKIKTIRKRDMERLQLYSWPGNVRELRNIIERASIQSPGEQLVLSAWMEESSDKSARRTLEEVEREHILRVLEECNGRVGGKLGAAEILGMKRTTLDSRMIKLGIKPARKEGQIN